MNRILLALLAAGIAAVMIFSPRSWSMLDSPKVVLLAPLPYSAPVEQVLNETESGVQIPYPAGPGQSGAAPPELIAAGRYLAFVYRDVSLLKMPFWSYADPGFVAVRPGAEGYLGELLSRDQVKRIDAATGGHAGDYHYPFWGNLWGWLFVAGFILWLVLQRRAEKEEGADEEGLQASEAAAG
jgi:hypothetical protein